MLYTGTCIGLDASNNVVLTKSFCSEANFTLKMTQGLYSVETSPFDVEVILDCAPNLVVNLAYTNNI